MSIPSLPTFSVNSNGKIWNSLTQFVWDANDSAHVCSEIR
jgi:hypothetical protein